MVCEKVFEMHITISEESHYTAVLVEKYISTVAEALPVLFDQCSLLGEETVSLLHKNSHLFFLSIIISTKSFIYFSTERLVGSCNVCCDAMDGSYRVFLIYLKIPISPGAYFWSKGLFEKYFLGWEGWGGGGLYMDAYTWTDICVLKTLFFCSNNCNFLKFSAHKMYVFIADFFTFLFLKMYLQL